jgi:hypothetical protein
MGRTEALEGVPHCRSFEHSAPLGIGGAEQGRGDGAFGGERADGCGYTWAKLHLQWKGLVAKAPRKGRSAGGGRRPVPGMV